MDHSGLFRLEPPGSRSLQIIENSASPASQIFRLSFPSSHCAQYSISVYPHIASPEAIEDLASGLGFL